MAEVLGLAASVIAVVQITGTIITYGYQYIGGVKNAPTDIQELMNELDALRKVLIDLKDFIDKNPSSKASQNLSHQCGSLLVCTGELKGLETMLKPRERWSFREMSKRLKWPLKEKETLQKISSIERHKGNLAVALATANIALSQEIQTCVQDIQADLRVENKAQITSRQRDDQNRVAKKRSEVLDWIYPETFDERHNEVKNMRQANTGGWLFERLQFKDWIKEQSKVKLLWGYGIPGAGKTFISSVVIDYLEEKAKAEDYGIVYVYFDYKEQDQQTPIHVLANLVKQLLCKLPNLPTNIEALYEKLVEEKKKLTLDELCIILFEIISSKPFARLFFVFDALDECDPDKQRAKLLPLFHRMAEKDGVSLFLTSRPHPDDIQDSFGNGAKIELLAQDQDIKTYIEGKINENSRAKRLISQGQLKSRTISDLTECAKGMFLLVRFQVEYICHQATTVNQILAELDRLKTSSATGKDRPLDPTYDRAMETLRSKQSENCKELALRTLAWLVEARRTLSFEELRVAVSIEQNRYELGELDLPDKVTLLDVCAGLVTIDNDTGTIRLAHYTVQEYLLEKSIPHDAKFRVVMTCIAYLSFDAFAEGACTSKDALSTRFRLNPFLCYAAPALPYHVKNHSEDLPASIIPKFLTCTGNMSSYLQAFHVWETYSGNLWCYESYPPKQSAIHVASSIPHLTALRQLLETDIDISATDSNGSTALHLGAGMGYEAVVQLLLEKGADISVQDNKGETPLIRAASNGHEAVVRLLLDKGANISVQDNEGETPLIRAASNGHEAFVRLLLDKGADISTRDNNGRTPLHRAVLRGRRAIVELLLDKGADISARDKDRSTSLHRAAFGRERAIVELLLDKGADVSAWDKNGRTPLHSAAFFGERAIVELLLDKGADISARDNDGRTPLHRAAFGGERAIFELLLDKGADVSARDNDENTPLHGTAFRGQRAIVELLLDKRVDISIQDNNGRKALEGSLSDWSINKSD